MDFAESFGYSLGGGLNLADAPEQIDDDEATALENVRSSGLGRWSPRLAAADVASGFYQLCGIHSMPHGTDAAGGVTGTVYLDFTGTAVKLYAADGKGKGATLVGTLAGWESVGVRPKTIAAVAGECLWIVDEGKEYGLTVYDPNERFESGKLFQPKFKFEPGLGTDPSAIFARTVSSFSNFLFVAGHGSEADPDRPEIVRFSYLGFDADSEGGGDAGKDGAPIFGDAGYDAAAEHAPGSAGLFDIDDYFPVGPRGQPIVEFTQAGSRLKIGTRFSAYILFGYDRTSFQVDLLDNQAGTVASRAGGEANGAAWWLSPIGFRMWAGGNVQSFGRKVHPRVREIDYDTVFFAHQPELDEVRWYYSSDTGDPNRVLAFNYVKDEWYEDRLGFRVFCGGTARPGTILRPGPGGEPIDNPDADPVDPDMDPPTDLTHTNITPHTAVAEWANHETGPSIRTRVYRRPTGETYELIGTVQSGVGRLPFTGLDAETDYDTKVEHFDVVTGKVSSSLEETFTTAASDAILAPQNFRVEARREIRSDGSPYVAVYIRWNLGQSNVYTTVRYYRPGDETIGMEGRNHSERNQTQIRIPFNYGDGSYIFSARHSSVFAFHESLNPEGQVSSWTDEITIDIDSVPASSASGGTTGGGTVDEGL